MYKTSAKVAEYESKLFKLSFQLRAELEYLAGKRSFQQATQMEENLNMDQLYDALDQFGNASKLAFEHEDIEMEAKCEAWIGKIFHKALRKETKALSHLNSVVRLANCLRPRDVSQTEWYRESKQALDEIREKRRLNEEQELER